VIDRVKAEFTGGEAELIRRRRDRSVITFCG
jgi:hypothetical protein